MILLVSSQILSGLEVDNLIKVIDHALQVRPAVDRSRLHASRRSLIVGDIGLVDIPQTIVVPAVEFNVALVIVADLQLGQVDDRAGQLGIQRDISVSLGGIAVAIDHKMDGDAVSDLNDVVHVSFLGRADPLAFRKGQNPSQGFSAHETVLFSRTLGVSVHKNINAKLNGILRVRNLGERIRARVTELCRPFARGAVGTRLRPIDALDPQVAQRGLHVIIGGAIRGRLDLFHALALDRGSARDQLPIFIFSVPPPSDDDVAAGLICVLIIGSSIKLLDEAGIIQSNGIGGDIRGVIHSIIRILTIAETVHTFGEGMVGGIHNALDLDLACQILFEARLAGIKGRIGIGLGTGLRAAGIALFVVVAALNGAITILVMVMQALLAHVAEAVAVLVNTNVLPNRVQRGGSGHNDGSAGLLAGCSSTLVGVPTQEGIAITGGHLRGNGEGMGLLILRGRLVGLAGRCAGAAVGVIVQRESQQNRCAFEIVVCRVLAVGKQGISTFAASVAAASGPADVVDFVVVNTLPDILCIGQPKSIVVDIVLAEVNSDVVATDAGNGMTVDLIADLDLDARHGIADGRMQDNGTVACRPDGGGDQAEHHHQAEQQRCDSFLH